MANEGDLGHEDEEFHRNMAIERHKAGVGVTMPRTGRCHNCGSTVAELFCDSDCRDDYEKRRIKEGLG